MGAWGYGIFENDDAGDHACIVGNLIGLKNDEIEFSLESSDKWSRAETKQVCSALVASKKNIMKLTDKASLKGLSKQDPFKEFQYSTGDDHDNLVQVIGALHIASRAPMTLKLKGIVAKAIRTEIKNVDDLGWDDGGDGRVEVLEALLKQVVPPKAKKIKVTVAKPKAEKTTLKATFPLVLVFDDYHEIDDMQNTLNKVFGTRIGAYECGFGSTGEGYDKYAALFYVGKRPSKTIMEQAMKDANFTMLIDDEEL